MEAPADALLLSIQWQYALLIFEGRKTVELRRTRPRAAVGTRALVYVPTPYKILVGGFVVGGVVHGDPGYLWRTIGRQAGVSHADFLRYFDGAAAGFGIHITAPWRLDTPVPLARMRERMPDLHPPQVFRYLSPAEHMCLVA
jgi:predicted transcriptional regulator